MLVNSLASEPKIGSPSRGRIFATTVERSADSFVLNGRKTWSTGGTHLTHMIVGAMLEDEPTNVLVESHREGIEVLETWDDALLLRATDNHDVFFRDVCVPVDNLAAHADAPQRFQPWAPMLFSTPYLGAGLAARDAVIRYPLECVRIAGDAGAGHMHPPNSDTAYETVGKGAIKLFSDR